MCPIRHFKNSTVECLDSYSNFVFAVDKVGELAVFLIDESDPENDDDTMVTRRIMLGQAPLQMYLYPSKARENQPATLSGELVVVTESHVHHFRFE